MENSEESEKFKIKPCDMVEKSPDTVSSCDSESVHETTEINVQKINENKFSKAKDKSNFNSGDVNSVDKTNKNNTIHVGSSKVDNVVFQKQSQIHSNDSNETLKSQNPMHSIALNMEGDVQTGSNLAKETKNISSDNSAIKTKLDLEHSNKEHELDKSLEFNVNNSKIKIEEGEEEFKGFPILEADLKNQDLIKNLSQKEEIELRELEIVVNEKNESRISPLPKRRKKDFEESDLSSHCSSPALSVTSQLSALSFTKRSRTGSPASKGSRKSMVDLSNPKYLVPFEYGWKREVVTRAITSKEDGISKDVYYFHPNGKKLRSLREVSEKLTPGLTIENFTFYKEALGADPQFETIRNARSRGYSPFEPTTPKSLFTPVTKTHSEKSDSEITSAKGSIEKELSPVKETPKPIPLKNFVKTPKEPSTTKQLSSKKEKLVLKFNKGTPKIALKKSPAVNGERKSPKMMLPKLEGPKPHPNAPSGPRRKITPRKKPIKPQGGNREDGKSLNKSDGGDLEMGMLPPLWSPTAGSNKSSSNESLTWSHLDEDNYSALLNVFQYLKVQELLRAGRVCRLWRDLASHSSLWRTVRMKNSQVSDWKGFTDSLSRHGTKHLDLRKMLMSLDDAEEMWAMFAKHISNVKCLERLDICRCSVKIVAQIMEACPQLLVFNAQQMIGTKDEILNQKLSLENLSKMKNLKELRLKSFFGLHLTDSLKSLTELSETLTTLSLTSVKNLGACKLQFIGKLQNLEALELGECSDLPESFPTEVIAKLTTLKRMRLEKGPWNCSTNEMLYQMSKLKNLVQLELINFDVRPGFDEALASCTNIKRLLLIPTYVTQSATTNNIILSGTYKLWKSLNLFVWVVTMELLKVTELFVDQCEGKGSKKSGGNSVPVLKPVPLPAVNQKESEDSKKR